MPDLISILMDHAWSDGQRTGRGSDAPSEQTLKAEAALRLVVDDMLKEYATAQYVAAFQIWSSILCRNGEPVWYATGAGSWSRH